MEPMTLCNWKGCVQAATHTYRWEWGEEGPCCGECIVLLQQTATNLSRSVTTRPIQGAVPDAPITRSERTHLIAAKLAAEDELQEVQLRGHQLYQANVDLTAQVQTHVMRAREHASLVAARDEEIERIQTDLERRERELADAVSELQRLRVLAQFAADPTETSRGLEPG